MTTERRVLVHPDTQSLTGSVAARFITKVIDLLDEKPVVHVVLTGGGVGTAILESIRGSEARDSVDWARVHIWWGDERWVDASSSDRNDTGARAALLDHVSLSSDHIHPFQHAGSGYDLDQAAASYAADLATWAQDGTGVPRFDITFLGVGADGHVASLFPDRPAVLERESMVLGVRQAPKPPAERMTLTLPAINASDRIWLCLAGADKASALGLALAGASPAQVPAAGVYGRRRTMFFVDAAAAAEVPSGLIETEY